MLLVMGRAISIVLNLATQVLCVRYLSKGDYGSFAYAIAMIEMLALLNTLGFDNSLPRFAAIYQQKKNARAFVGIVIFSFCLVVLLGLAFMGLGDLGVDYWSEWINANPLAVDLMLIMLVLAPIQAIDALMQGLFGVFSGARHIFLRQYIVRPVLRLAAVIFMIMSEGDSTTLAIAYVVVGIGGVAVFLGAMVRVVSQSELMKSWDKEIEYRMRETLMYNVPIMTSNLVFIFRSAMIVFLLEYFHNAHEVADYQAVRPIGRLIELVLSNFAILFIPAISRAFAAESREEISQTYISTQIWITLLSFPLFALSFGFADILTPLLFGQEYVSASEVLAWIALGFYIRIIFGLAMRTLKVLGHLRTVIAIDVVTLFFALFVCLWSIPAYGAMGAAIGALLTVVFHGLSGQIALYRLRKIGLWDRDSRGLYATVATTVALLAALRWGFEVNPWIQGLVAMMFAVILIVVFRRHFAIARNFPELLPMLNSILARMKG